MEASLCPSADLLLDWRSRLLARRMCRGASVGRGADPSRIYSPGSFYSGSRSACDVVHVEHPALLRIPREL